MRLFERFTILLYLLTVATLAAVGFVPALSDTWYFNLLWIVWTILLISAIARTHMHSKPMLLAIHTSIVIILIGAAVTRFCGTNGIVTLAPGHTSTAMIDHGEPIKLPFRLTLDSLVITRYSDTDIARNYFSHLRIDGSQATVSVNNVINVHGYRIYQSSVLADGSTVLKVSHDPIGIWMTYLGYAILLAAGLWMSVSNRNTGFRHKRHTPIWIALSAGAIIIWQISRFVSLFVSTGYAPLTTVADTLGLLSLLLALGAWMLGRTDSVPLRHTAVILLVIALYCPIAAHMTGTRHSATPAPVLTGSWLTIHVTLMMSAYSMLVLMFAASVTAIFKRKSHELRRLCTGLLPAAVWLLTAGIISGAVWANQSWGRYWGWDPKETWALITWMLYVLPLHRTIQNKLRNRRLNIYLIIVTLAPIITYFGISCLPSLHSY